MPDPLTLSAAEQATLHHIVRYFPGLVEQRAGAPVARAPHRLPPPADRAHGKARGVVVDPTLTQPALRVRS